MTLGLVVVHCSIFQKCCGPITELYKKTYQLRVSKTEKNSGDEGIQKLTKNITHLITFRLIFFFETILPNFASIEMITDFAKLFYESVTRSRSRKLDIKTTSY